MKQRRALPVRGRRRLAVLLQTSALTGFVFAAPAGADVLPLTQSEDRRSEAQIAQDVQFSFEIPAQPLADALTAFGQQSGLQVTLDASIVTGLSAPAVIGSMTPEEALGRLLSGTGITWQFLDTKTVALEKVAAGGGDALTLDPLRVEGLQETAWGPVDGYIATRSATGTKTDTPIIETPQSISVVTRDQMDAQAVENIPDALSYVPGVLPEIYGVDTRQDWFMIRGFQQNESGLYRDGLQLRAFGYATWRLEPYGAERIEVLRGPSSVLYGQTGPGGLVNYITKRPTPEAFQAVEVQTGSFNRLQGAFDLGGPLTEDGSLLYRLTGLGRLADTQVDYVEDDRLFIAPAVTWQPTDDTTLTILSNFQYDHTGSTTNFLPGSGTFLPNPNGQIPLDRFTGEPDFDEYDKTQWSLGYLLEHRLSDVWTLRQNARYAYVEVDQKQVYGLGLASEDEDPTQRTLLRQAFVAAPQAAAFSIDNNAQADFVTGPLEHTLLLGLDWQRYHGINKTGYGEAPPLDVYDPDYGAPVTNPGFNTNDDETLQNQIGFYVQEQLTLYDRWVLVLGGRYDRVIDRTENHLDGTTERQDYGDFSGRVGLVYLSDVGLAPYVSYSQSFLPVAGTNGNSQPFEPETGEQYEVGLRYQPPGVDLFIAIAAFDLRRQNVLTQDPDNVLANVQTGEVRSRGFEFEATASLLDGLDLIATYTYQDVEITKSNYEDEEGKRPYAVPKQMASLWANYTLQDGMLEGLGFGAGVRYVGSTYAENTNLTELPSYTLFDAGLSYERDGLRLAVNAKNLFDKEYVASCSSDVNFCYYGTGRTVIATLAYRW